MSLLCLWLCASENQTDSHGNISHFLVRIACVASVSVRFRSKERGRRVKDCAKNGASKKAGRGWRRRESRFPSFSSLSLLFHFLALVSDSRAAKTASFFAPKPNGNACYAGYIVRAKLRNPTQHNQPWGSYPCGKNCLTFKYKSDGTNFIHIPLYRSPQVKPDLAYHSSDRL